MKNVNQFSQSAWFIMISRLILLYEDKETKMIVDMKNIDYKLSTGDSIGFFMNE